MSCDYRRSSSVVTRRGDPKGHCVCPINSLNEDIRNKTVRKAEKQILNHSLTSQSPRRGRRAYFCFFFNLGKIYLKQHGKGIERKKRRKVIEL